MFVNINIIIICCLLHTSKQTKCPLAVDKQYTKAGIHLHNQNRLLESLECFELALKTHRTVNNFKNLATIHIQLGNWNSAENTLTNGLEKFPKSTEMYQTYITMYFKQNRYLEALKVARKWVQLSPDILVSNIYIASTLYEIGNKVESIFYYEKALEIDPNHVPSLVNSAVIYNSNGEHSRAVAMATRGVKLDPGILEGHVVLGAASISIGQYKNAIVSLENALKIDSNHIQSKCKLINARRHLCDWSHYTEDVSELARILKIESEQKSLISAANSQQCNSPGNLLFFELPPDLLLGCAYITSQKLVISLAEQRAITAKHILNSQSNRGVVSSLKIGFVSFNFNNHPASHILTPLFHYLSNQSGLQIFAYSLNPIRDKWTQNIQNSVHTFRNVSHLDIPSILETILHDGIDVLVDLMGYTVGSRSEIFACRPAPVQVSYLGYPGTIGDTAVIDYTICDNVACQVALVDFEFEEKIIFIPPPYFPAPHFGITEPGTMDILQQKLELNIPADKFVYCCLSKLSKISIKIFQTWIQILSNAPNAILWLISRPIESVEFIQNFSKANGLTNQIVFSAPLSRPNYLKYAPYLCDLFLDTSPYNAHTVAAEMLSRGLPILTKRGVSLAGRVASSLLSSINTNELIADSFFEYKRFAIGFYENPKSLMEIRNRILTEIKKKDSNAFNINKFGSSFSSGMKQVWHNHKQGYPPKHTFID